MSDSDLYSRLLLPKGHGYPLFHPQPFDDWPLESRQRGIQIGDVGIVTADGSFDAIFNICRPADDPLNRFGVPEGFTQVHLKPRDIASRSQYHRPGSDVSNTKITKRRLDVDAGVESNVFLPVGAGAVVEISAASKEAAVLLLPDGASRTDLRPSQKFRDYALKNAQRWYAFVNGELQRMVESGDLYLVTGVDKSTSWSVAAVENHSGDCRISMKLKASPVGSAGTSCTWEWETTSSFADSGPRRRPGEEDWTDNQTVFLRGYKVAIRSRSSRLRKPCTALSVVHSKPAHILSRSGFVPFSQLSSPSGFFRSAHGSGGASDDRDSVEYFPQTLRPYHPASAINEYLLASNPDVDVAVTHDDEWASVMYPNEEGMPSDRQLVERILRRYKIGTSSDGAWLQEDPSRIDAHHAVPSEELLCADRREVFEAHPADDAPVELECESVAAEPSQDSEAEDPVDAFTCADGRNLKALLIGVRGSTAASQDHPELKGAHQDVLKMRDLLIERYNYSASDIVVLLDDGVHDHAQPTRVNILKAIGDLVKDAKSGDGFCFYYCGHSAQIDSHSSEEEGMDECLIPSDGLDNIIVHKELNNSLVKPLPSGSQLVAIMDTCHSDTLLDLKHMRCNRVYVPWVFRGNRTNDERRRSVVRSIARLASILPRRKNLSSPSTNPARRLLAPHSEFISNLTSDLSPRRYAPEAFDSDDRDSMSPSSEEYSAQEGQQRVLEQHDLEEDRDHNDVPPELELRHTEPAEHGALQRLPPPVATVLRSSKSSSS